MSEFDHGVQWLNGRGQSPGVTTKARILAWVWDSASGRLDSNPAGGTSLRNVVGLPHFTNWCLLEETLKLVGPFYRVSVLEEVKVPTEGINTCVTCRGLQNS